MATVGQLYETLRVQLRQRAHLKGLWPGAAKRLNTSFLVPLEAEPQTVYAGARIRGGPWFSNAAVELPARR